MSSEVELEVSSRAGPLLSKPRIIREVWAGRRRCRCQKRGIGNTSQAWVWQARIRQIYVVFSFPFPGQHRLTHSSAQIGALCLMVVATNFRSPAISDELK